MNISKASLFKGGCYEIGDFKSQFEHDSDLAFQLFCTEGVTEILFVLARGSIVHPQLFCFNLEEQMS